MFQIKFAQGFSPLEDLGIVLPPPEVHDPSKVRCNFCGNDHEPTSSTQGNGPLKMFKDEIPVHNTEGKLVGYEEKIRFSTSKVSACPDCCLRLHGRTRFPETVG